MEIYKWWYKDAFVKRVLRLKGIKRAFKIFKVVLASLQSMQSGLADIERCKEELHIAEGAVGDLLVFSKVRELRQQLEELEQLTHEQVSLLEVQKEV